MLTGHSEYRDIKLTELKRLNAVWPEAAVVA